MGRERERVLSLRSWESHDLLGAEVPACLLEGLPHSCPEPLTKTPSKATGCLGACGGITVHLSLGP